jgi:hypothetical protein
LHTEVAVVSLAIGELVPDCETVQGGTAGEGHGVLLDEDVLAHVDEVALPGVLVVACNKMSKSS